MDTRAAPDVVVLDEFLAPPQIRALSARAAAHRDRGAFRAARVGTGTQSARREDIRGDATCWLAEPFCDVERVLLGELESLRVALNAENFLGLFDLELHYAWYPPGSGYARHVDQPHGRDQRKVSVIVYLNEHWDPGAGGELRVFGADGSFRDIAPIGGRLVHFLTEGRQHAVLPTRRERLSISGWFRARD